MSWFRAKLLSILIDGQVLVRSGNGFASAEISTLTPAGNWLPGTTASYDLGVTGTRWRDLFLSRNATVGGTLGVTGATTLSAAAGVVIDDASVSAVTRGLTLSHTTSATAQAGVGAGLLFRAESAAGTLRSAGAVDAIHTTVTDGAEVSAVLVSAGIAGSLLEVARFAAVASAVNGIAVTASATGTPVVIAARGSDTDVWIALRAKGIGAALLSDSAGTGFIGVRTTGITVDSGTDTGATPTVNRNTGTVRVQSGNTTVTVNNSLCTATSKVFAQICETTTNAVSVLRVTRGAGSFVITLSGDPGASHADIVFWMVQPD